jgi:NAD(P)-dependent dehydrogenase (short-subunit alcohol dehydrogenase family)
MAEGVALVTGASRGIGASVAERLAADGMAVACAATSVEGAEATAARLRAEHGTEALALAVRVEDRSEVEAALDVVEDRLGPISLLVNNAGVAGVVPFLEVEPEQFAWVVDVNLTGVFHGSQAAARRMVASGTRGSIIQIGSIAGINAFPNRVGYCATKAAVHQMTRVMALDLAEVGIRVNCVAPGYIRTDMVQDLIEAGKLDEAPLRRRVPLGDLGTAADIAAAVSWLASTEARYVTGETVVVDGGWLAYGHI